MCPVAFADMPVTAKVVWTNPLQQVQQEFSPLRSAERTSEARLICASLSLMRLVTCADRVPFVDFPKVDLNPDMVHFPKRKGSSLPWGVKQLNPLCGGWLCLHVKGSMRSVQILASYLHKWLPKCLLREGRCASQAKR